MNRVMLVLALIFCIAWISQAQLVNPPVRCDIGIGGGLTVPTGDLSDADNSGWNAGGKARFSGLIPLDLVASGYYNRLANKVGSESSVIYGGGAGIEYTFPTPGITPYVGVQGLVNILTSTAADAQSTTREGLGIGGGVQIEIPVIGHFDVSLQYQMLNLIGKETDEKTLSQVAATAYLMFNVF